MTLDEAREILKQPVNSISEKDFQIAVDTLLDENERIRKDLWNKANAEIAATEERRQAQYRES